MKKIFISLISFVMLMGMFMFSPDLFTSKAKADTIYLGYFNTKANGSGGWFSSQYVRPGENVSISVRDGTRYNNFGQQAPSLQPEGLRVWLVNKSTGTATVKKNLNYGYATFTGMKGGYYKVYIEDWWGNYYYTGQLHQG